MADGGEPIRLFSGPLSMFGAKAQIAVLEKGVEVDLVMVPFSMERLYEPKHPSHAHQPEAAGARACPRCGGDLRFHPDLRVSGGFAAGARVMAGRDRRTRSGPPLRAQVG